MTGSSVEQRTSLLNELHIERDKPADGRFGATLRWIALIGVIGVGAVWLARLRLDVAPAQPPPAAAPALTAKIDNQPALEASGYIIARRQATLSSKITGRIIEMPIEEGQHVAKDQIIARLDDANTLAALAQAQAEVERAQANVRAAIGARDDGRSTYTRSEQLRALGLISEQSFDTASANYHSAQLAVEVAERGVAVSRASLAATEQSQADTIVRAPFSGVATARIAQTGDVVSPLPSGAAATTSGILTVVDLASLALDVDVSENYISSVHPRQTVAVTLNAYPDRRIPAQVVTVIPSADRAKATVKVRVALNTNDPRILPGMGARVSFFNDTTSVHEINALRSQEQHGAKSEIN